MKIIPSYILKSFFSILGIAMISLTGFYVVVDFFEKLDEILSHQVVLKDMAIYLFYSLPSIILQCIPVAVLLSALIAAGLIQRGRETVVIHAAGLHPMVYAGPILVSAFLLSAVSFVFDEGVACPMNRVANKILRDKIEKEKKRVRWSSDSIWYYDNNTIFQIKFYNQRSKTLEKVSIYQMDSEFSLNKRMDVKRIQWQQNKWMGFNGVSIDFTGSRVIQQKFDRQPIDLLRETPKGFETIILTHGELTWFELFRYTRQLIKNGYNPLSQQIELHSRLATPFGTFIMAIIGIMVVVRREFFSGIAQGVAISLIVLFVYHLTVQFGISMSLAETLPPFAGVWLGNMIFGIIGLYFWKKTFS